MAERVHQLGYDVLDLRFDYGKWLSLPWLEKRATIENRSRIHQHNPKIVE